MSNSFHHRTLPGLLLTACISFVAVFLSNVHFVQTSHLSALTLALVMGMVAGNTFYPRIAASSGSGVQFAKKNLLQIGIVLYGFRITFQQISEVGWAGMMIDALVLSSTFFLAYVIGTKWFGLDRQTAILIGAGSAICGSSAVLATESVLKADAAKVAVAVSTVVIFGTLAMFLYPLLFQLNHALMWLPDARSFGMFTGSTMHDVGQVVAAGLQMDDATASAAVITKMLRVMMLAPFLLGLSLWWTARKDPAHSGNGRITIPWFALMFIAVAGLNSQNLIPAALVHGLRTLDTWVLAMATAGLGLSTHVSAVRKAGFKPMLLAGLLFAYLVFGGALINQLIRSVC
jgi:uncharacterized integral membrane protein (TIGR00698 family)